MRAIKFFQGRLQYLDQSQLPLKEVWRQCKNIEQGYEAIKLLQVRGAPLIGVFAAYCACINMHRLSSDKRSFTMSFLKSLEYLRKCRPTAVNLSWALERLKNVVDKNKDKTVNQIKKEILRQAIDIHKEDVLLCRRIARNGSYLIKAGDRILTHCNAGFLATSGNGTALGVIYEAAKKHKNIIVYADETRPLLQGVRLSAWELGKNRIKSFVVCDSSAAFLMQQGIINKVIVGADRIAANGDTANKIGTHAVAIAAQYHGVPFYIAAPSSTFDLSLSGGEKIPIEKRPGREIRQIQGKIRVASPKVHAYNPAFDVTSHKLIKAIITDKGIIFPPFNKNISKVLLAK
ncbi:MAG: S-methyl-5-thioribose-1-phosphate isomerase [Candidatus Omnitrophica bacterium]|nr:S-methyl-5-thioribose-1-phosphate isomerase [Candidatus Omnitrophota bacterium]MDD5429588.1 S-methyl-5-thioribose-1-phosphate isomerase [Candidatus Omnitrophota bacterium]